MAAVVGRVRAEVELRVMSQYLQCEKRGGVAVETVLVAQSL